MTSFNLATFWSWMEPNIMYYVFNFGIHRWAKRKIFYYFYLASLMIRTMSKFYINILFLAPLVWLLYLCKILRLQMMRWSWTNRCGQTGNLLAIATLARQLATICQALLCCLPPFCHIANVHTSTGHILGTSKVQFSWSTSVIKVISHDIDIHVLDENKL